MRICKLYLVVCAAAFCGGVIAARADDNPDQAAARAALEAKMRELNAEPATNTTPPPVQTTPPQQAQPAAPTTPATQNPPPAAPAKQQQPAPVTVSPSGTAEQSMNPPATAASVPARTTGHASTTSNSNHGWFEPVPPPSGSRPVTTESKEENPAPSTTVQTPPPAPVQQPVYTEQHENPNPTYPGKRLGLKPIEAPPLPITESQQAELQALLEKYEANAITPEQYQAERARIMHQNH